MLAITTCGFFASTDTAAYPHPGFASGVISVHSPELELNFHTAPFVPPPGPGAVLYEMYSVPSDAQMPCVGRSAVGCPATASHVAPASLLLNRLFCPISETPAKIVLLAFPLLPLLGHTPQK